MIAHLDQVTLAELNILGYLFHYPNEKWLFDFISEKTFTNEVNCNFFLCFKENKTKKFWDYFARYPIPLRYILPASAVRDCMYLMEYRLALFFYDYFKKQNLTIADHDTILVRDAIEFLSINHEDVSLWDACIFIFEKFKKESARINIQPLEEVLTNFNARLANIKENLKNTTSVENFLNSDFTIVYKSPLKMEAAKKITKMAYLDRIDESALVQAMCEIAEVGAEKMKAIIKILNS